LPVRAAGQARPLTVEEPAEESYLFEGDFE
jgi:hypothetical protein